MIFMFYMRNKTADNFVRGEIFKYIRWKHFIYFVLKYKIRGEKIKMRRNLKYGDNIHH